MGKIKEKYWSAIFTYRSDKIRIISARRARKNEKEIYIEFPLWMIKSLDKEAKRLGVSKESIIKVWIAERLHTTTE